jgi:hypothetical protein
VAVPIVVAIAAILVTGLVSLVGKYLFHFARNTLARSMAEICKAAIEGKITATDAEKLIRAHARADADSKQVANVDGAGEARGSDGDSERSEGKHLRRDKTSALPALARVILMLRRFHLP